MKAETFWKVAVDTKHFSFEAYGKTKEEAKKALMVGLDKHREQYQCWMKDIEQDFVYFELSLGKAYRDQEEL